MRRALSLAAPLSASSTPRSRRRADCQSASRSQSVEQRRAMLAQLPVSLSVSVFSFGWFSFCFCSGGNSHIAFTCVAPAAICQRWRKFPLDRASDGIRISLQIGRSFLLDFLRVSARCVPSPRRESYSASIRHASLPRFVSLAFPYPVPNRKLTNREHSPFFAFRCASIVCYDKLYSI